MRWPKSLLFFVATGAVYLLQILPVPGIFFMVMLAAFWSVVLVNAGMIGVGVEAASGSVPRPWLLLPLLWFGVYGAMTLRDHVALWRLQRDIAQNNARVHVPFDPGRQALVFVQGDGSWLVENSALPAAFSRSGTMTGASHRSTRMVDRSVCQRVRSAPGFVRAGIYATGFHDDSETIGGGRFETRFCTIDQPLDPTLPAVTVAAVKRHRSIGGLPVTESLTTITTPDRRRYVLRGGVAAPLAWLPMPVLGCALDSATPAWRCFHVFMRDAFTPLALDGARFHKDDATLRTALGLATVAPGERRGSDPGLALQSIETARDRVIDIETAALDRAIADPLVTLDPVPFSSLYGRMDIIVPRLHRIVAAVDQGVAAGGATRGSVQELSALLRQVPPRQVDAARRTYRQRHAGSPPKP